MLLYTSKKITSNRWLALFIFVVSESAILMELDYLQLWVNHSWLLLLMAPLTFALGPLLYFYTYSLIFPERKLGWKSYLNFVPLLLGMKHQIIFILYITGVLSIPFIQNFYFLPQVQNFLFGPGTLEVILSFVSLVIYAVIIYKIVLRHLRSKELSAYKLADVKWIRKLLHVTFVLIIFWLLSIIINAGGQQGIWKHYIVYIPAILVAYGLGITAYGRQSKMPVENMLEYASRPFKIYFSDEEAYQYRQQLTKLMDENHLYLDPLLKLDVLASSLSVPEKSVSNLLNQYIGKNFNDFVNQYRVEAAKKKLTDPGYRHFTISAIAFDCGFNSLATFQRVFKQMTGVTPSCYQNDCKLSTDSTQIPI